MEQLNDYKRFKEIILSSDLICDVLKLMETLKLPDCWLTGGVIRCTIWNYLHSYDLNKNIKDIDILYYSKSPIFTDKNMYIKNIPVEFENQAYIHNWYNEAYDLNLSPLTSVEDGLKFWSDSCSSILMRLNNGTLELKTLMGLEDILNGIIRPTTQRYEYGLSSNDYFNRLEKWKVSEQYPNIKIFKI